MTFEEWKNSPQGRQACSKDILHFESYEELLHIRLEFAYAAGAQEYRDRLQAAESKLSEVEVAPNKNDYIDDFSQQVRDSLSLGMKQVYFDTESCAGVLKEIHSLVERVRISESKLEEMSKQEPSAWRTKTAFGDFIYREANPEKYADFYKWERLFLHPQVQSNADKEIEVPECADEYMLEVGEDSLKRNLKLFSDNYTQVVSNIWEDMHYAATEKRECGCLNCEEGYPCNFAKSAAQ